ncbi:hypothetical protein Pmani_008642 [Petrolisthes manimaculis]|uniref:Uncharacterized protein n=1 Tax=Petrolisthes manimaculis TaxID=1843537 RepID=A0AAE1Q5U9_9EUCA|nr:hypothetical protein Pmani_008642 [Petrolisthes manimaculis]
MNFSEDEETQDLFKTFPLGKELFKQMGRRFPAMEGVFIVAAATLLDPRFKKVPFANTNNVKTVEERLVSIMQGKHTENCLSTSNAATATPQIAPSPVQPRKKIILE